MLRFVFKLIVFVLFVLIGSALINTFTDGFSYYWGREGYSEKIECIDNQVDEFNAFYFGSSRTSYHINPSIVDSVVDAKHNFKSYNLGVAGGFCPEHYYLYEEFLNSRYSENCQYVFLELSPVIVKETTQLLNDWSSYWLKLNNLSYIFKILSDENHGFRTKLYRKSSFVIGYLYKSLGLRNIRSLYNKSIKNPECDNPTLKGFKGLITAERERPIDVDYFNIYIKKSFNFDKLNHGVYLNKSHLSKLKELIKISEERNVELFFFIPPRIPRQEVYGLKKELGNNVIDLSNSILYPSLYELESTYDPGHLNKLGAKYYSIYLAEEINKRFNN